MYLCCLHTPFEITSDIRWAQEIALLSARRHTSVGLDMAVDVGDKSSHLQSALPLRLFTAYIDQVTFKDKGEVGDRIMLTSQCCRSFGGILEIEVKAEAFKAHDPQPRAINLAYVMHSPALRIGNTACSYFCVSGVDGRGRPLVFADVIPESDDERSRYTMSQVPFSTRCRKVCVVSFCTGPHACSSYQSRRSIV